jgi:hypothetical protein
MSSTISKVNFELVTDNLPVIKRDVSLADQTLAVPTNPVALTDGEWCTLDSNGKLIRVTDITNLSAIGAVKSFPVWFELGRYDRQAMSRKATTVLYRGEYEAETRVYDALVGTPITTMLQWLKARTIAIGTRNFTGLVGHGGSGDTDPVIGYVTKLPSSNGGKLRFISGCRL